MCGEEKTIVGRRGRGEERSWGGEVMGRRGHGEEGCVGREDDRGEERSWGGGVAACGVMLDNALLGFGHHIFVSW